MSVEMNVDARYAIRDMRSFFLYGGGDHKYGLFIKKGVKLPIDSQIESVTSEVRISASHAHRISY